MAWLRLASRCMVPLAVVTVGCSTPAPVARQAAKVAAAPVPVHYLRWNYPLPMPAPDTLFEIWWTPSLPPTWQLLTVTNQPPVPLVGLGDSGFFIGRATNPVTGEVGPWNLP